MADSGRQVPCGCPGRADPSPPHNSLMSRGQGIGGEGRRWTGHNMEWSGTDDDRMAITLIALASGGGVQCSLRCNAADVRIELYSVIGGVWRTVHKVCTGPYLSAIVVPSTRNNEPCYAFI